MNSIEVNGLQYFFYLNWHAPSDAYSISFIPKDESLQNILNEKLAADKILYELFTYLDEYFYALRNRFDFHPMFQENVALFEIQIIKKDISNQELSGLIHEHLRAA